MTSGAGASQNPEQRAWTQRGWLGAILALATASRLYELDFPDVWVDEANLILTAQQPFPALFERLAFDSSPPLYYVAIRLWSAVFGESALALRSLSVLGGVGLVWATWWVGRDLLSPRAGLWAAFYLAANPSASFFSQQVRMYGWLALFALLSLAGLMRFLRDGRQRDLALWLVASILALYCHNFAFHLGLAQVGLIAISGQLRARIRTWTLAAAIVAGAYAPWIPTLLEQLANADHYAWFLPLWESDGVTGSVVRSLRSYSPGLEFLNYAGAARAGIGASQILPGVSTFGACALAAFGAWLSIRRIRACGWALALWPVLGFAVPVLSALSLSLLLTPHYVPGRVDQMMLPEFALLVGAAIAQLRPWVLRGALGVAIGLLAIGARLPLYDEYRDPAIAGCDRALANAILARWQPDDVIITTSLSRASLAYYLRRSGLDARIVSFPRDSANHLGAQNDARLLRDRAGLLREAEQVLATARRLTGSRGRVFVVWVLGEVNYPLRRGALPGFSEEASLGRFRQFGTGAMIEVRQVRALPEGVRSGSTGGAPAQQDFAGPISADALVVALDPVGEQRRVRAQ